MESNPDVPRQYGLFEAFGVECEYMIVDAATLDVRPVADKLLLEAATLPGAEPYFESGTAIPTEVGLGPVSWSNELCAHVIELKTATPASSLDHVADSFQDSVALANAMLAPMRCALLPTGMHPWMNPDRDMKLWPHGFNEIYAAFDRIFNCKGHGWCNLQSAHLNLPFNSDDEFARLHAAIRALLPIMPALAASSPIIDGATSRSLDNRMAVYARNARTIASVAGDVIPEPVWSHAEYQRVILDRIYADLKPHDPEGILAHEWCNSRGCIARFSRNTIEVRVLDVQECPAADLAILKFISAILRWLSEKRSPHQAALRSLPTSRLRAILDLTIDGADTAIISDASYLAALGLPPTPTPALRLWQALRESADASFDQQTNEILDVIFREGSLATRIRRRLGDRTDHRSLQAIYADLARCLASGKLFRA
ncbi:MAG: glutamate--cysteine ligase [Phycisphaerales bacterium]|nr:glutamate--cysteine ligase [Phycisphaerales bacterium]